MLSSFETPPGSTEWRKWRHRHRTARGKGLVAVCAVGHGNGLGRLVKTEFSREETIGTYGKWMKYDERLWNLRYRWKYMALFFLYFLFSFWSTRNKLVREETTGPYPANLQCRQTTPLQVTLAFAAICCNDQQISLHFTSVRCSGQHPRDLECCSFCCTWLSKGAKLFEWKQHKRNQEMYAFNWQSPSTISEAKNTCTV